MKKEISIFWFRRDLRFHDNPGLYQLLKSTKEVLPIYIFDNEEIGKEKTDDPRISFVYDTLQKLNLTLRRKGKGGISIYRGNVLEVFKDLLQKYNVTKVFFNHCYEPYEIERDHLIKTLLIASGVEVKTFNSQLIFEKEDVLTNQNKPYSVFGPYKRKWLQKLAYTPLLNLFIDNLWGSFTTESTPFPGRNEIGLIESTIQVKPYQLTSTSLSNYHHSKDYPFKDTTSLISTHLRYGTASIYRLVEQAKNNNEKFLSQLIWREFYTQILFFFPHVVHKSFKPRYDLISWDNDEGQFERWRNGYTGIPIIDAGMRQLNTTGYMHGRVRMLCASFLCKNLLIDWRWGESYFAEKLLDYDLALNNGNWQWAAGSGCDAAPYFRVFNPKLQQEKFDKNYQYIRHWIEDFNEFTYPHPMVNLKISKQKAIERYQSALRIKEIA